MTPGDALALLNNAVVWSGGVCLIAGGLFSGVCAYFEWDWVTEDRMFRFISSRLGRNGARIFYGIYGPLLVAIGILLLKYFLVKSIDL
jgi:immunity protein 17 of polymorphic toxin system